MEIRNILRGENITFAPARPARKEEGAASARATADRVELSRQWLGVMEEQRARLEEALRQPAGEQDKDEGGLLGYMETEEEKLDALTEQLDVQMKCMKIAANIMKGKKVPPEDERYLMEHDPEGYKLAISMRSMAKKDDDEECESVLDDEDKKETSETGESSAGGSEAG